jgi:hypothetical protein
LKFYDHLPYKNREDRQNLSVIYQKNSLSGGQSIFLSAVCEDLDLLFISFKNKTIYLLFITKKIFLLKQFKIEINYGREKRS